MHRRSIFPLASLIAIAIVPFACTEVTPAPRIFVSRVPEGSRGSREDGEALKMTRWELEARPGLKRGYAVVRSELEWRQLWPSLEADRIPLLPHGIDFSSELLVVAAPSDEHAMDVRINKVIETPENGIHVYVARELPGEGCPASEDDTQPVPVDLVRIPMVHQKEFHFHVETVHDDPCEPPPESKIACRLNGTTAALQPHLVVEPGKSVACLSEGKPGSRPTVDTTWSFRSLPLGTAAKMTIAPGSKGVSFGTDAFGTYAIQLEVSDDLGRVGKATVDVEVAPPKDVLVVQMVWTKFDPDDDPSTFPRVELHVVGEKPPPMADVAKYGKFAARATPWILVHGDCTVANDKPPPWCKARVVGPTTIEELMIDAYPQYRIGVRYVDDRYEGQPVLCVRTYRGAVAGEWCDKNARAGGNWWDVARVEAMTGKAPEPVKAAAASASASASATASASASASASAPASASAKPPATPAPAPKKSAKPEGVAPPSISVKPAPAKPKGSADPWTP